MITREEFSDLYFKWKEETMILSNLCAIYENEHHQKIISFGYEVLPFIFENCEDGLWDWFHALQEITGENPADGIDNWEEAETIWLLWGIDKGYIKI